MYEYEILDKQDRQEPMHFDGEQAISVVLGPFRSICRCFSMQVLTGKYKITS